MCRQDGFDFVNDSNCIFFFFVTDRAHGQSFVFAVANENAELAGFIFFDLDAALDFLGCFFALGCFFDWFLRGGLFLGGLGDGRVQGYKASGAGGGDKCQDHAADERLHAISGDTVRGGSGESRSRGRPRHEVRQQQELLCESDRLAIEYCLVGSKLSMVRERLAGEVGHSGNGESAAQ